MIAKPIRLSLPLLFLFFGLVQAKPNRPGKITDLNGVWRAACNHDATRIIVQMRNGTIGIWDTRQGIPIPGELGVHTTKGQYASNKSGELAVIFPQEGKPRVIDLSTAKFVSPEFDATCHKNDHGLPRLYFTPDDSSLIFFDNQGHAKIFEISSGRLIADLQVTKAIPDWGSPSPTEIIFTNEGKVALILDLNGILYRYNAQTWKEIGPAMAHPNKNAGHYGMAATENGKHAVTFDHPGENGPSGFMQLWEVKAGKPVGEPMKAVNGLSGKFYDEGKRLLVTPARGETRIVRVPELNVVANSPRHDDVEASFARLTHDEQQIITWGYDSKTWLLESATGKHQGIYSSPARLQRVLVGPEPDYALFVYDNTAFRSHYDQYIVSISLERMRPTASLRIPDYIHSSILSPDGSSLIVLEGTTDKERIRLFDARSLRELPSTAQ